MSTRTHKIQLGDVLAQFQEGLKKTAEGLTPEQEAALAQGDPQAPIMDSMQLGGPAQAQPTEEELAAAAAAEEEDRAREAQAAQAAQDVQEPEGTPIIDEDSAIEEAAKNVAEASAAKEDAVEALKEIASQAQANEAELMGKEAEEFGKLFAESFAEELEKKAALEQAEINAAQMTFQKLAEDEEAEFVNMLSKTAEESRELTLLKLASEGVSEPSDVSLESLYKVAEESHALTLQKLAEAEGCQDEPVEEADEEKATKKEEDVSSVTPVDVVNGETDEKTAELIYKAASIYAEAFTTTKLALDDAASQEEAGEYDDELAPEDEEGEDVKTTTNEDLEV